MSTSKVARNERRTALLIVPWIVLLVFIVWVRSDGPFSTTEHRECPTPTLGP